jgi:RNA polymerase sigma-70 factor (sigma-E family)
LVCDNLPVIAARLLGVAVIAVGTEARVGRPDVAAFTEWVVARESALLWTAWLLTGSESAAEDLVQTTLERCWRHWGRVSRADDVNAYARRVLVTTHASRQRRHWMGEIPTEDLPEEAQDSAALEAVVVRSGLVGALDLLPRGQREVVVLRFAEDLSEAQTADLLGCSVGTVKSQSSRALRTLRRILAGEAQ